MITIKDLSYKYKTGDFSLSNINLEIKDNEFVTIIGQNGSGKSTFSKLLSGLVKFKKGKILAPLPKGTVTVGDCGFGQAQDLPLHF